MMTTIQFAKVAVLATLMACAISAPFAGRILTADDAPAGDPFGGESAPADASALDPFGGGSGTVDPFGPAPQANVTTHQKSDGNAEGTPSTNETPRAAIRYFDAKDRAPSELAIERALRAKSEGDFFDEPLADVLKYFGDRHRIPIAIDRFALEEMGLTTDAPVTARLSGISLRSMLKHVLRDLQLTFVIRDEVLLITTLDQAEQLLETRVYVVPQVYSSNPSEVASLLREMTPGSWSQSGGPGFVGVLGDRLVVQQTQRMHDQIQGLFGQLLRASKMPSDE